LHIVGVHTSNDIYGVYFADDPSDEQLLRWSRIFTGLFGIVVVAIATYQAAFGELALIAVIGAYGWGTLGGSLFIAVAAGMFWKRATKEGAIAAVVLGFVGGVGGRVLAQQGIWPLHEIILATMLSILGMVVVSLITDRVEDENLAPIFDDVSHAEASADD
jgi:Na+/proline symporter